MVYNERITPEQKILLVHLIRQKQLRVLRRHAAGEINSPVLMITRSEWKEMAAQLNPLSPGPGKSADDWLTSWSSIKSRLRIKYLGTETPPPPPETEPEKEMLAIIVTQQKAYESLKKKTPMDGSAALSATPVDGEQQSASSSEQPADHVAGDDDAEEASTSKADQSTRSEETSQERQPMNAAQKALMVKRNVAKSFDTDTNGRSNYKLSKEEWSSLAQELNLLGPVKSAQKWQEAYKSLKSKTKRKYATFKRNNRIHPQLTANDRAILSIVIRQKALAENKKMFGPSDHAEDDDSGDDDSTCDEDADEQSPDESSTAAELLAATQDHQTGPCAPKNHAPSDESTEEEDYSSDGDDEDDDDGDDGYDEDADQSAPKPTTNATDTSVYKPGKTIYRNHKRLREARLLKTLPADATTTIMRERNHLLKTQLEDMRLAHEGAERQRKEVLVQKRKESQKTEKFRRALLADELEAIELKRQRLELLMGDEYRS